MSRVIACAEQVQGNIRLIAYRPTVMARRARRNEENISGLHLGHGAVIYGGGRSPGDDDSDVPYLTALLAKGGADVLGPLPAWRIRCAADLENRPFNLRDTLEGVMRTLALRADEKGLELLCELAPETPELVRFRVWRGTQRHDVAALRSSVAWRY